MKSSRLIGAPLVLLATLSATFAAPTFTVIAHQTMTVARPSEVIIVPWAEVIKQFPDARPEKLLIRDEHGASVPYQFTNFHPDDRHGAYDQVLFQHDFAVGERDAHFTVEKLPAPALPFPEKVFARYVPERYDDFAWENDRIAHRIYGPGLDSEAAGRTRMVSSGIDVWVKRVRYLIVNRWYLRGHDNYHQDNGEGLDLYSVDTGRGCGGTGIWDGQKLFVSKNWKTWRVMANGPLRAIFELTYEPWDAGNGVMVSEVKRFTVDAGSNLDTMESTFTFSGAPELTVAVGVGKHKAAVTTVTRVKEDGSLSLWEKYPKPWEGQLGTAAILPGDQLVGYAEDNLSQLALVKVKSGVPIRYYTGAGWTFSGNFSSEADWNQYIAAFAARLRSPISVTVSATP